MSLAVERLESRDQPAAMASSGGVVYLLDGSDRSFTPFETATVPVQLAQDGGTIWVGAGLGGGPRLQARNARTLAVLSDVFVGDPASRTGVSVAVFQPTHTSLLAQPHPQAPAPADAVARVQGVIDQYLPPAVAGRLAAAGLSVEVYTGRTITDLPDYAGLGGVATPVVGDGDRTYDGVPAVFDPARFVVVLPAGVDTATTLHEIGHAAETLLAGNQRAGWLALHDSVDWPSQYETNEGEGFAETARRVWSGAAQPDPRLVPFFESVMGG